MRGSSCCPWPRRQSRGCSGLVLPEAPETRELVAYLQERGFDSLWAREGQAGYDIIDGESVDALICDLSGERIDGLRLVKVAKQRNAEPDQFLAEHRMFAIGVLSQNQQFARCGQVMHLVEIRFGDDGQEREAGKPENQRHADAPADRVLGLLWRAAHGAAV